MKRNDFANLPAEIKEEVNKIKFFPIDEMNEQIKLKGSKVVKDKIVKILVEEETDRRVTLIHKGMEVLDKKCKEYISIKPEPGEFSKDLQQGPEKYSAEAGKKKLRLFEEIQNITNALNSATEDNDIAPLEKVTK